MRSGTILRSSPLFDKADTLMAWLLLLLTETAAAGPDQPWNEGDVEMFGGGIFALLALGFILAAIKSFPLQAISLLLGTISAYASSFIVGGAGGLLFGCLVVVLAPRWINEFIVSIRTRPNTNHAQSGDEVTYGTNPPKAKEHRETEGVEPSLVQENPAKLQSVPTVEYVKPTHPDDAHDQFRAWVAQQGRLVQQVYDTALADIQPSRSMWAPVLLFIAIGMLFERSVTSALIGAGVGLGWWAVRNLGSVSPQVRAMNTERIQSLELLERRQLAVCGRCKQFHRVSENAGEHMTCQQCGALIHIPPKQQTGSGHPALASSRNEDTSPD